jgi:hypothetical protein
MMQMQISTAFTIIQKQWEKKKLKGKEIKTKKKTDMIE